MEETGFGVHVDVREGNEPFSRSTCVCVCVEQLVLRLKLAPSDHFKQEQSRHLLHIPNRQIRKAVGLWLLLVGKT